MRHMGKHHWKGKGGKAGGKRQWLEKRLEIQTRIQLSKTMCAVLMHINHRFNSTVIHHLLRAGHILLFLCV